MGQVRTWLSTQDKLNLHPLICVQTAHVLSTELSGVHVKTQLWKKIPDQAVEENDLRLDA